MMLLRNRILIFKQRIKQRIILTEAVVMHETGYVDSIWNT